MTSNNHVEEIFELPGDPVAISPYSSSAAIGKNGIDLKDDGRVDIDLDSNLMRRFSMLHTSQFLRRPSTPPPEYSELPPQVDDATTRELGHLPKYPEPVTENGKAWNVKLNIVIQVVGSRGDVQPFIALGNELMRYGHRVRLATHGIFESFVRDSGLEFYPIGGDPAELMAYMVKNPGLIPTMKSLGAGEIHRKRLMIRQMLSGCWQSCIEPDMTTHEPFVADAIIANPPSFAHVHCAQALSIPVHLMFTMPWSSTKAFPHPLANLRCDNADQDLKNYISYDVVNWLTWQGVGDVINQWRKELDLDEVAMFEGPYLAEILRVPFTYCWSPALIPKPSDWPSYIDVCGFFFRDFCQYEPPADLQAFLASGPPPIYIGFGSIVLDDPEKITAIIISAVNAAGVRAIISKGWSNLGGTENDNIYSIGDCPHEWLFQQVAAVVHHGGAGTTACGLRNAGPTIIVPFFGDQPFWGAMVAAAGAGPAPIPYKKLSVEALSQGIQYCLTEQVATAASAIAIKMSSEAGVRAAVSSFHRNLPLERLQCDLYPGQPAVWSFAKGRRKIKILKIAAEMLVTERLMEKFSDVCEVHAIKPIVIENRRWDPITGGASAVVGTSTALTASILGTFYKPFKEYQDYHENRRDRPSSSSSHRPIQRPASRSSSGNTSSRMTNHGEELDNLGTMDTTIFETSSLSHFKEPSDHHKIRLAGRMAGASAKSLASFGPTALKGMMVDFPLAIAEGMRNVPRYYGEEPRDHGPVTDIKSGFAVAGKSFAWGMAEAVSDIVVQPYQGMQEDSARGAVKGIGKGIANMASKSGCAMFGVLAYPSAGIAKSLQSSIHSKTRKKIDKARHSEGVWLLKDGRCKEPNSVFTTFQGQFKGKKR